MSRPHPLQKIKSWFHPQPKAGLPDMADDQELAAEPVPSVAPETSIDKLPEQLLWLLDAPLFIDEKQVNAFYDAILKPDYEGASITLSSSISKDTTIGATATVGANIPWLVKAEAEGSVERAKGAEAGRDHTYTPVSNAFRHLLALALHYAAGPELSSRLVIADLADEGGISDGSGHPMDGHWLNQDFIRELPRALVFLDIPGGARFIPAALELTNGEVHVLAEELATRLSEKAEKYPKAYPGSRASEAEKDEYFEWFEENWDDRIALKVLEASVKEHPSAWIAFNVSVQGKPEVGRFMHLNVAGRGQYDTGVFGYNFITRGFNYGIRIVGTLKSGPDLNVLAIFER